MVCLDDKTFKVPKRKGRDRLIQEGKMKEVSIGTAGEVDQKITKLFPHIPSFRYMKVLTTSHEVIPAQPPDGQEAWCGSAVMSLAEGGNVYVKAVVYEKPSNVQPHADPRRLLNLNPPLLWHLADTLLPSCWHLTPVWHLLQPVLPSHLMVPVLPL